MAHDASTGGDFKKILMKVFWILLAITVVEIIWGMKISHALPKWLNAIFFLTLTLVKAAYIVAEFMHLKYETKAFRASVLVPLVLFFWFIVAFCYDGGSFLDNRVKHNTEMIIKGETKSDHNTNGTEKH